MIVPDTNVVSEAMQPQPDGTVIAWLNAQAVESLEIWRAKSPTLFDKRPTGLPGLDRGGRLMTETQKTRTGTDGDENKTRPYRYGDFDILAVSMQPSTGKWDRYMYTVGRWLLPGKQEGEMATLQPVTMEPGEFWTNDFRTAAQWLRADDSGKRMKLTPKALVKKVPAKQAARPKKS